MARAAFASPRRTSLRSRPPATASSDSLEPLTSFVLAGGTPPAAALHVARTTCRRAERHAVGLARQAPVNPHALSYLNRLSDLLFILARSANDHGRGDVLWQPGSSVT